MNSLLFKRCSCIIFLIFFGLSSFLSYSQEWRKINGIGRYINFINYDVYHDSTIIVGSDFFPTDISEVNINFPTLLGDGYQVSTNGGESFGDFIQSGYSFFNIIQDPNNQSKWYASVRKQNRGGIIVSQNSGTDWTTFPLLCDGVYQIFDIISVDNPKTFYSAAVNTAEGIIKTENDFQDCTPVGPNVSSRSIKLSHADKNFMFIAGDKSQGDWGVFRSTDKGKTWQKDVVGLENLRILCVQPSGRYPELVYCGADSITLMGVSIGKGIYQSLDTGKTWKPISAKGYRVFSISEHPKYPQHLAAACDSGGVYISSCDGYNWEHHSDGIPQNSSVRHVMIPPWEPNQDGFVTFASVFEDGLYKSINMTTKVFDSDYSIHNLSIISLYPTPVRDLLTIDWYNNNYGFIEIYICNMLGEKVGQIEKGNFSEGSHTTVWKPAVELSQGIYNIIINSGNDIITQKFIYIK